MKGASMATVMSQIKATASAHLTRDILLGRKWTCECEACHELRSLVGMKKILEVRPLVRKIRQIEDQSQRVPDGPEMQVLVQRYEALCDQLADVVSK
jgi:hypothetical protein